MGGAGGAHDVIRSIFSGTFLNTGPHHASERSEMLERARREAGPQAVENRVRAIVRAGHRSVDLQVIYPVGMYFLLPAEDR